MQESGPLSHLSQPSGGSFGNTDWWMVQQASRPKEPNADPARSKLCNAYWKPVFQHILRSGYSWHDAEDLAQEFFARVLEHNSLQTAAREKGKFRSFLLTLLKRFLADQSDRRRCQKRGGGTPLLSLDSGDTEFRRRLEPVDTSDPETLCEREWLDSILHDALAQLKLECAARGKEGIFEALSDWVTGQSEGTYAEAAASLNLSETNVRVLVHRMRKRLRQLLSAALKDA